MRSTFLVISLATLVAAPGHAQRAAGPAKVADSARIEIERAATAGDAARLLAARRLLDAALAGASDDAMLLHYQGYASYRLANIAAPAERAAYLAEARDALRRSAALRPLPESFMLLSVVESRLATMDSADAARLDADAERAARSALLTSGADNPRVLLLSAISALYTPPSLDGGTVAAERLLNKSIALYATDHPAPPLPSWGRAESYAWLGQVYERTGRDRRALAAYNRALALEPRFAWVRDALLPALRRRLR